MTGASLGYDGYYKSISLYDVGLLGGWWLATVRNIERSYDIHVGTEGRIYPQDSYYKYAGRAVHCVNQT